MDMEGHTQASPVSATFAPSHPSWSPTVETNREADECTIASVHPSSPSPNPLDDGINRDERACREADERTVASVHRSVGSKTSVDSGVDRNEKTEVDVEAVTAKQDTEDGPPAPTHFPEGGLQAWATVAGAFCVQFCGFGYTSSFGVYQDLYVNEYMTNQTASTISWIGSMNSFLVMGSGLLSGFLCDRGYFYPTICAGSILLSLGIFMLSLAQRDQFYQVFLSQSVCAGIGAGLLFVPSYAVIGHYFQKRRTVAMTIVASGSSLGATLHPIMLNNLFNTLSFGNAVRASAGLVTGMLLCACLLMRTRLPPPKKTLALLPAVKKFSRDPPYVLAAVGLTLFSLGFWFPLYYLQLDASSHGLSSTFSFYSLVILNFSSCIGRLTTGFVAHAIGVPTTITIATGCYAAVVIGMIGLKSVTSVVLVGVFAGYFFGSYIALNAPLFAILSDDFSEAGARMGIAFTLSAFGGLIGSPISGALLGSESYTWWKPALFSGLTCFGGSACFLAATIALRRRRAIV